MGATPDSVVTAQEDLDLEESFNTLIAQIKDYNPSTNHTLLRKAYLYARSAHVLQKRSSGEPFLTHPLNVALILTEFKVDDSTIVAALLHDVLEDTAILPENLSAIFGHEITSLVSSLTKLKRLNAVSKEVFQARNFRKVLLAMASDIRVLLIKLADRLHNMRTLRFLDPNDQHRIAIETTETYAPLAARMGVQTIREELEDLSFAFLNPKLHAYITRKLNHNAQHTLMLVTKIEDELTTKLKAFGINADVVGRKKQPYSIWLKMERKSISFEQLSDLIGFRILVHSVIDCYTVLGIVHTTWTSVPGRFKDYISTPKANDYSAIHTTIVGPLQQRVELQIRTFAMHHIAEHGIAAHYKYKDQPEDSLDSAAPIEHISRAYHWLRETVALIGEGQSVEEFVEHTKLALFQDHVFCFTPKGQLITLPAGSNSIDFAYAVHTDVGNSAVGTKINGRYSTMFAQLSNGDEVQILCSPRAKPPYEWVKYAKTARAKTAIKRVNFKSVV